MPSLLRKLLPPPPHDLLDDLLLSYNEISMVCLNHLPRSRVIQNSTYIPGGCPVSDVKLFVDPPRPKKNADITVSFRPGFHLNPNDNITIVKHLSLSIGIVLYIHITSTLSDIGRLHFGSSNQWARPKLSTRATEHQYCGVSLQH